MNTYPTVGRIVHFVLDQGPNAGQIRPAIITRVWRDSREKAATLDGESVQLTVFPDAANDELGTTYGVSSAAYGPEFMRPRTWHWPARD